MRYIYCLLFCLFSTMSFGQDSMRPVEELINNKEPGWPIVKGWIDSAKNKIEILPADSTDAKQALYYVQVSSRSPMGAIVYATGGLLIDGGWIRILGSGSSKLKRSLPEWNRGKVYKEYGTKPPFILIADDVIGGFFLLNGGGLGDDLGKVYYFSPDNIVIEPLDLTYTEFLLFCFNNDLNEFYKGLRWNGWEKDVKDITGDVVYSFSPFLWTIEGTDINKAVRSQVPVEEQFQFNMQVRERIEADKKQ